MKDEHMILLGELKASVDGLKDDMAEVKLDVATVRSVLDRGKGILAGVLAIGGALGAAGGWVASWFRGE